MKTSLVVLFSILAVALAIPGDDPVDAPSETGDNVKLALVEKTDSPQPEIEGQIPVQIVYGNTGAEDSSSKEHSRPKRFLLSKLLFAKAVLFPPFTYRAQYSTAPGGGSVVVRKSWNPWFPFNVQVTGSGTGAASGSSSVTQTASAPVNYVYRKTWTPWNVQVTSNVASAATTGTTNTVATETAAAPEAAPAATATQSVSAPAGYVYTKSFSPWNVQVSSNAISAPAQTSEVAVAPASTVTQTFSVPSNIRIEKTWG